MAYLVAQGGRLHEVEWSPVDLYDTIALRAVSHSSRCFLWERGES